MHPNVIPRVDIENIRISTLLRVSTELWDSFCAEDTRAAVILKVKRGLGNTMLKRLCKEPRVKIMNATGLNEDTLNHVVLFLA